MSKSRQLQLRSFSARFSPGHVIERHSHAWAQLVFASEGVIAVEALKACWVVPTHRAIWVPAGFEHSIRMHGRVFLQSVYFQAQLAAQVGLACNAYEVPPLLRELVIAVCQQGIINGDTEEQRNLIRFLVFQVRKLRPLSLSIPLPQDPRGECFARQVIDFPGTPQSLGDLCAGCGTSLRTMQRVFAEELGLSLSRWRNQVRMVHAIQLLAGGKAITGIAHELGFESMSAFIHAFRRHFGVSPGQYRSRQAGKVS